MARMSIVAHPSRAALAQACAEAIEAALAAALRARGAALLIATGGSTAPLVYPALAPARLDWAKVTLILSDERWVGADHAARNDRMVEETLRAGPAQAAQFLRFPAAPGDPGMAAAAFNQAHASLGPADVALLGVGEDLHVGSVFPRGAGMGEARVGAGPSAATTPEPLPANAPYPRLTLTLPFLARTGAILAALTGEAKRRALENARPEAPIMALAAQAEGRLAAHWAP